MGEGGGRVQNKEGNWNFKKFVDIGNEWKNRHECLILIRSEASKNKVIIKRVSNISIN